MSFPMFNFLKGVTCLWSLVPGYFLVLLFSGTSSLPSNDLPSQITLDLLHKFLDSKWEYSCTRDGKAWESKFHPFSELDLQVSFGQENSVWKNRTWMSLQANQHESRFDLSEFNEGQAVLGEAWLKNLNEFMSRMKESTISNCNGPDGYPKYPFMDISKEMNEIGNLCAEKSWNNLRLSFRGGTGDNDGVSFSLKQRENNKNDLIFSSETEYGEDVHLIIPFPRDDTLNYVYFPQHNATAEINSDVGNSEHLRNLIVTTTIINNNGTVTATHFKHEKKHKKPLVRNFTADIFENAEANFFRENGMKESFRELEAPSQIITLEEYEYRFNALDFMLTANQTVNERPDGSMEVWIFQNVKSEAWPAASHSLRQMYLIDEVEWSEVMQCRFPWVEITCNRKRGDKVFEFMFTPGSVLSSSQLRFNSLEGYYSITLDLKGFDYGSIYKIIYKEESCKKTCFSMKLVRENIWTQFRVTSTLTRMNFEITDEFLYMEISYEEELEDVLSLLSTKIIELKRAITASSYTPLTEILDSIFGPMRNRKEKQSAMYLLRSFVGGFIESIIGEQTDASNGKGLLPFNIEELIKRAQTIFSENQMVKIEKNRLIFKYNFQGM